MELVDKKPTETQTGDGHQVFYSRAYLYDVAFGYRKFDVECDFLEQCFAAHAGRKPTSFLELAADPHQSHRPKQLWRL